MISLMRPITHSNHTTTMQAPRQNYLGKAL